MKAIATKTIFVSAIVGALLVWPFAQDRAQSPAPEGKEKPKAEEKKEAKPVKPLEKPCAGKLLVRHAYSVCGPDKVWHVVEDDYYDCPPVQKFRVYDHPTEQPCDKPPPDPIKDGYVEFNGSGCVDYKDIGPMDVYECYNGFWYLVTYEVYECSDGRRLVSLKDRKQTGKPCKEEKPEIALPTIALNQLPTTGRETLAALVAENKVRTNITGTGETIGHIADVRIDNLNDQTGSVPPDSHSHLKRNDADKLLRITKSKYDTADKLEKDGALKGIPYKDKKKRKEVIEQWSVWSDPQISEIEGG